MYKGKRSGNTVSKMLNVIRETRSQAEEQQQVQTLEERQKQVLETMLKQPGLKNPDAILKRLASLDRKIKQKTKNRTGN